jgi:hypothetical protein
MKRRPTPRLTTRFYCTDAHYPNHVDIHSIEMCREGGLFSRICMSEKSRLEK